MSQKISHDSETPAKGQQVITACAFIWHEFEGVKKVFLPKRAETKKFLPGIHELPGGHIEFGEDIVAGLKREIKEEFHVEAEVGEVFYVFTYLNDIKGAHVIEVVYLAEFSEPLEKIKINPEDHSEFGWFSENELDQLLSESKNEYGPEIEAIRKGFRAVNGKK